jgi:hypothetical protein
MKNSLVQFIVAFVICSAIFWALDAALMNMQGLSLVFHE